jgi:hypothetical protein
MSNAPTLRAGAAALALSCIALGATALQVGRAAWAARPAQDALVRLDGGRQLVDGDFAAASAAAAHASALRPRAGAYDELTARLALHAARMAADRGSREDALAVARDAAARARAARPAWPYAAILAAAAADAAGDHGPGFVAAVADAWRAGRHEARIREALAGLWLHGAARAVAPPLEAAFDAELGIAPVTWIDRADRAGAAAEACTRALDASPARARCAELGWNASPAPGNGAHDDALQPG